MISLPIIQVCIRSGKHELAPWYKNFITALADRDQPMSETEFFEMHGMLVMPGRMCFRSTNDRTMFLIKFA